ncbi:MAG: FAD-binding oxidoreductase [Cohaesibacter sp.]|jgi:glycine/D-amino acid oxidase-like deaminating enzyme|nr:FAD-binding oxidoreductase [Cohaesibacter sp.]
MTKPKIRKIKKQPNDTGISGWYKIAENGSKCQKLEENITSDWLVIGAGFAGLAAARRLHQLRPNDRITLLEARHVGEGPAGRNSGFMIDLPHDLSSDNYSGEGSEKDNLQTELNREAIRFAAQAAEDYGISSEVFDPCGKINGAATEKGASHNLDYAKLLEQSGESYEMLDAQAMREVTGSDYYLDGLFTPGTVMIQPAAFVRAVADNLRPHIGIYENSPVIKLSRQSSDWLVETPSGSVSAPKIILAVNGHAQSFGYFPGRLMHVFTYASMTRALSSDEVRVLGGQSKWSLTPADPMGATIRRICGTGGDRIITRTRFTYDPSMEVSQSRVEAVGKTQIDAFQRRFPMIGTVPMEYVWAGRLCLSFNGVSAFGEVEENIFSACAQNGLGAAKGTFSGMMAAELATGTHSVYLDHMLAQDPPSRLPPEPFAWLGANAVMRWREWRAGKEA